MQDIYKGDRRDDWRTPQKLWNCLNNEYVFQTDLAADFENTKCINHYYTVESNTLVAEWPKDQVCWLNPPFSQAEAFFKKCAREAGNGIKIVAIYKSANLETKTWQRWILPNADWVYFLDKRVNYDDHEGNPTNGVPFGSAIIGFNVWKPISSNGFIINLN